MILRKPYAFFIKFFKVFHIIMALFIGLLIYHTAKILHFFNTYINDYRLATDGFATGDYINLYIFVLVLLVIIANIIILSVMILKKKPKWLYIYNLLAFIALIVFFGICYQTLSSINSTILDVRVSKAIRDISVIFIILQALSFILVLVRGTGFDFKKFDFTSDLEQLKIEEKDNEEVEVAFEIDKNKIHRNIRKNFRQIKYFYLERKFLINVALIVFVIVMSFIIYFNLSVYTANYKQNEYFSASGFSMRVKETYIINSDYEGDKITNNTSLVVIRFDVRRVGFTEKLNTGVLNLRIGTNSYGQTPNYNKKIADLGEGYAGQKLTDEYEPYIITFEIPSTDANKKMKLKINDNISYVKGQMGAKSIIVKLDLTTLNEKKTVNNKIKNEIDFKGSVLEGSSFKIDSAEISNKFKLSYNFCASSNKCYESFEYVTPTATGNYAKTLIKIKGKFTPASDENVPGVNDLLDFLNMFGYIEYDGKMAKISSRQVKANTVKEANTYYIEIPREALNAKKIDLIFNVRNFTYNYTIK